MSTLRVSTLEDTSGSNGSTPAQIASGRAKAWVNFNGTGTVAIRAQFNVSSITDNGTGDYTVNFATAMPDTSYVVTGTGTTEFSIGTVTPNTGSVRVFHARYGTGQADSAQVNVAIFR
jgi:hypothetical protein